ncbi:hypothetical protein ACB087_00600 [Vibrio sp. VNB-15]
MNKLIALIIAVASLQLTGCASKPRYEPMPNGHYSVFPQLEASMELCLAKGLIDPSLMADVRTSMTYMQNTFTDMNWTRWNNANQAFKDASPDDSVNTATCNQAASYAHQFVNTVVERKQTIQRNNQYNQNQQLINSVNSINNSINKPVFCNNIAGTVICN